MKKKYKYVPKGAVESVNLEEVGYTKEEIAFAREEVVKEENTKGLSALDKASIAWTVISTLYSVISVCTFVFKGWVDSTFSRVLIVMLAVYVAIFVALVVLVFRNPKRAKGDIKTYKKTLGIFKAFVNVVYLALSAVSMASLALSETTLVSWLIFGGTFLVAVVQLSLKIAQFAIKQTRKAIGKKFKVEITTYVEGKKKRKGVIDSINEKTYK